MKKTIEERSKEIADKCDHCYPRMGGACGFCLAEALLEVRNEALEEMKEILNEAIEDEKEIGKKAKGHLASQHYGAMMVLENLQEAIRERIKVKNV